MEDILSKTDSSDILQFIKFRKSFTKKELSEFAKEDYIEKQKIKVAKEEEEKQIQEMENDLIK